MLSAVCAAPRGLAARIVWLCLILYDRFKRKVGSPEGPGGTREAMETTRGAPTPGSDEPAPLAAHGLTHTGKQPRNEDCHLLREDLGLVVVADGFSGTAGGDIAARLAVDEIAGCFGAHEEQTLPAFEMHELADGLAVATVRFAIEHAHKRVQYTAGRTGPPGMSTAVAVLLVAGPEVVVGHVGSVRVYRLRGDALEQLTRHDPEGAPVAWRVGAASGSVQPMICVDAWQPDDQYLLCTAGLHRVVGPEPIRSTLAARLGLAEGVMALVGHVLHAGAPDNVTVVLAAPRPAGR